MSHTYHNTVLGQMLRISLHTLQMEAGTACQLLTDPTPPLTYLSPEDQDHVLRCKDPRATTVWYNALVTLQSSIVTICGSSLMWTVLRNCCSHWLRYSTDTILPNLIPSTTPATLSRLLKKAITDQQAIRWDQSLWGYLSISWIETQCAEHPKLLPKGLQLTWGKHIVLAMWQFHHQMWEHQNRILHQNTEQTRQIQELPIDAQMIAFFEKRPQFAAADRSVFDLPLSSSFNHISTHQKELDCPSKKIRSNSTPTFGRRSNVGHPLLSSQTCSYVLPLLHHPSESTFQPPASWGMKYYQQATPKLQNVSSLPSPTDARMGSGMEYSSPTTRITIYCKNDFKFPSRVEYPQGRKRKEG